ncbi:hypothetical protein GM528_13420, partial [Streptococcus pneumoniae]|nr:hypothetical protein [Streptococcus pneumoniae]
NDIHAKIINTRVSGITGLTGQNIKKLPSNELVMEVSGSSMKNVLCLGRVDRTRTTSNQMVDVMETFGIEACRKLIVE